ncbi:MAG: cation:proton antiporter [Thermoplasmata archaeon]
MIQDIESIRLLVDITIMLFGALVFGYIVSKLKQPVILGYLFAGIIIGPFALGLIGKVEDVHTLSQIGVTLLLFVVGLEFSPKTLKKIWKISVIGGILEMTFVFFLGFGVGMLFNLGIVQSVFLGSILSISSTIVVIRVLQNLGEEKELAGRIMIGLLIVQDIGVIVFVTVLSNVFIVEGNNFLDYIIPIAYNLAYVILILLIGRLALPKILSYVGKLENKGLFLVTILVISLGTASFAYMLGIPLALGAFLAGLVLAESEYGLEIVNKIRPIRDIFVILFFVSIGMSLNIFLLGGNMLLLSAIVLTMVIGKFVILSLSSKVFGYTTKTALKVGLGMIQIGEFSFIMAELGYLNDLISHELYSYVITTAMITIIITPYSIMNSDKIYKWLRQFEYLSKFINKIFPEAKEKIEFDKKEDIEDHAVLIGYGTVGHLTVDTILPYRKPFVVIDHDPKKMDILDELNFPYIYGDATSSHILERANIKNAKLAVVTIPGERDVKTIVDIVRNINPDCEIIARVHSKNLKKDIEDKVDHIIYPEVLGSKAVAKVVENHIQKNNN